MSPFCDHLEKEAWVSEGRLELESTELEVERRGGGWVWSGSLLQYCWGAVAA